MSIGERIKEKLPLSSTEMQQIMQQLVEYMQAQFAEMMERITVIEKNLFENSKTENDNLREELFQLKKDFVVLKQQQYKELSKIQNCLIEINDLLQEKCIEINQNTEQKKKDIIKTIHWRTDRLEEIYNRHTPRTELSFEVALAEHCNLCCAGCDHFSAIAEPEFADIEEFKRDFARLSKLFNGQAQEIHLLGGEPLLHPDIVQFIQTARICFPDAVIYITTNGILLQQMKDVFWVACHDNKIVIQPTKYPINLNYTALETLAAEHGVEYRYFGNTGTTIKTLDKYPLDLMGSQDARRSFRLCHRANKCIYLQHGKLYTCTVAPTIRHLNKRFGLNLIESSEDYIDIYSAKSAQEILEFLACPIPFCKYCMPEKIKRGIEWHQSNGILSEWIL